MSPALVCGPSGVDCFGGGAGGGAGVVDYGSGDRYEGEVIDGRLHGQGARARHGRARRRRRRPRHPLIRGVQAAFPFLAGLYLCSNTLRGWADKIKIKIQ